MISNNLINIWVDKISADKIEKTIKEANKWDVKKCVLIKWGWFCNCDLIKIQVWNTWYTFNY